MILTHRPVPHALSQGFGSNATEGIAPREYGTPAERLVYLFGNYQRVGHLASDFACPSGTPVGSAAAGTVVFAGLSQHMPRDIAVKYGYIYGSPDSGNIVVVDHGDNTATAYSHMAEVHVRAGQKVDGGHTLGLSGATGRVDGAHLHFEYMTLPINYNSPYYSRVDPMKQFQGGIQTVGAAIPQEEDEMPAFSDHTIHDQHGKPTSPEKLLNSLDRKQDQQGAVLSELKGLISQNMQLTSAILATRIPDPTDRSKSYTIADYIVWAATNAKTAAGAASKALENSDPEALAQAVATAQSGITAKSVAERLQINITTKEATE